MPNVNGDLIKELLATFRAEAAEHLQTLNRNLLQLERSAPDTGDAAAAQRRTLIQESFRAAHSLKGAARAVSFNTVEQLAHGLENVLQVYRSTERLIEPSICDVLYMTLDAIQQILDGDEAPVEELTQRLNGVVTTLTPPAQPAQTTAPALPEPPAAPCAETSAPVPSVVTMPPVPTVPVPSAAIQSVQTAPTVQAVQAVQAMPAVPSVPAVSAATVVTQEGEATPAAPAPASDETLRLAITKLDDLMAEVGELLVSKSSAEQHLAGMHVIREKLLRWPRTWREIRMLLPQLNGEVGQQFSAVLLKHHEEIQHLTHAVQELSQAMSRDTMRLGLVSGQLQDSVRRMRMVSFNMLSMTLFRTVRDAAHTEHKMASLRIEGSETELDKKILEVLKDPLIHLLRNAIVHGIESPEQRAAAGKAPEGRVTLTVQQRGSEVRIAVSDDGRGFDLQGLRSVSEKHGAVLAENASTGDIIGLAFLPGISTTHEVTTLAGRGVGLDVVKRCLEGIQGRILVDSSPGRGSMIQLVVPTSVSMTRGLIVRIGTESYVLPLLAVERILELEASAIFTVEGQPAIHLNDRTLPVAALAQVLKREQHQQPAAASRLAVIVAVADSRLALLVDEVMTEQELAVKPLGALLQRVQNVTGAALMGNGQPVVVLNAADLIKSARRTVHAALFTPELSQSGPRQMPTVLVVDDSITTRTLEKNILEAAGYTVFTATDGVGALAQLDDHGDIEIIVSDVQMPTMDGIALTRYLRESSKYNELPLILVTSLESREDREKGMLAGANAYIVKRGFDQAELLSTVENLLGAN